MARQSFERVPVWTRELRSFVRHTTAKLLPTDDPSVDPFSLFVLLEESLDAIRKEASRKGEALSALWWIPKFNFYTDTKKGDDGKVKSRLVGAPNESMAALHHLFERFIKEACSRASVGNNIGKVNLVKLPSATAFVPGSSPLENIRKHARSEYFYILDLRRAYDELNTDILTMLLVGILASPQYDD